MTTQMNVLIIDDDSTVRQSLGQALAIENYRVVSAANSREAMRTFCENKIDIVLLDLNLGLESGWDIFRHLTAIKPWFQSLSPRARSISSNLLEDQLTR
jgi:DNA-binding response OmpR family regulator